MSATRHCGPVPGGQCLVGAEGDDWVTGLSSTYHTFLITQDLVIFHGHTTMVIMKIIFHNFKLIFSPLKMSGKSKSTCIFIT